MEYVNLFENVSSGTKKFTRLKLLKEKENNLKEEKNTSFIEYCKGNNQKKILNDISNNNILNSKENICKILHTIQTSLNVKTLLQPLYINQKISKEQYKNIAKRVTYKFISEFHEKDFQKPITFTPKRKERIHNLLHLELISSNIHI